MAHGFRLGDGQGVLEIGQKWIAILGSWAPWLKLSLLSVLEARQILQTFQGHTDISEAHNLTNKRQQPANRTGWQGATRGKVILFELYCGSGPLSLYYIHTHAHIKTHIYTHCTTTKMKSVTESEIQEINSLKKYAHDIFMNLWISYIWCLWISYFWYLWIS